MKVVFDSDFFLKLKKVNVRIRNSFKQKIDIFTKDQYNPELNNHALKYGLEGYRSIDITSDWRAIYEEILIGEETVAYFIALGTHRQLYGK